MQTNKARDVVAQFFLELARTGAAWGLSCCGDLCAVFGHGMRCLPLWSSEKVAQQMQRRYWPNLHVARVALDTIRDDCVPAARKQGVPFGLGVAVHAETVAVTTALMQEGLAAVLELRRKREAN